MKIESKTNLEQILQTHSIPIEKWTGKDRSKRIEDLWEEIEKHESVLEVTKQGKLMRNCYVVTADIYYTNPKNHKIIRLIERVQVKTNGLENYRSKGLKGAVAEKRSLSETIPKAIQRGIKEELGLEIPTENIGESKKFVETRTTKTYPGLISRYHIDVARVKLPAHLFCPNDKILKLKNNSIKYAYLEVQPTKTTYFCWEE